MYFTYISSKEWDDSQVRTKTRCLKKITRRNSFQESETPNPVSANSKHKLKKKTKPLLNTKCNTHTRKCSVLGSPFAPFPFSTLLCPRRAQMATEGSGSPAPLCSAGGGLRADLSGEKPKLSDLFLWFPLASFPQQKVTILLQAGFPPSTF